jgi:hypothetical protein
MTWLAAGLVGRSAVRRRPGWRSGGRNGQYDRPHRCGPVVQYGQADRYGQLPGGFHGRRHHRPGCRTASARLIRRTASVDRTSSCRTVGSVGRHGHGLPTSGRAEVVHWSCDPPGECRRHQGEPCENATMALPPKRKGHRSKKSRRRPTLPGGLPPSTIGAGELNCRVRNGNGCFPAAMATGNHALVPRGPPTKRRTIHGTSRSGVPLPLSVPERARAKSQALGRLVPVG